MSLIGTALGGMIDNQRNRRAYEQEKKLMGIQQQHQYALNRQGHDLQMDMWNKTNYGAQVKHMIEAGLNPALMYKGAGAGGTTGSQTGGGAGGGSAPMPKQMNIANMLIKAQIDDLKASAEKKRTEAEKLSGVDTEVGKQNILESIARENNLNKDSELKAQKKVESISQEALNRTKAKIDQLKIDNDITGSTLLDAFKTLGLEPKENEEDMWIARGMVGAWLGKDYVKMVLDFKNPKKNLKKQY